MGRRQHQGGHTEGQAQSQEVGGENVEPENQSRGTASRRVPHLEKEMDQMRRVMDKTRENMKRVLVDNGSSADILYYPAFQQMRLGRDGR